MDEETEVTAPAVDTPEHDLRDAIGLLKHCISEARAAGYVVDLPFPETALDAIAISETAKVSA